MVRKTSLACIFLATALPTAAQEPSQGATEPRDGRFAMTPAADGFLRLDTRTGAVSFCKPAPSGVDCRSGPDERAALQAEIDRLSKENEDLKRKVAAAAAPGERLRNALPTEQEVDKALSWMEQMMRRMMRVFKDEPAPDRT